MRSYRSDAGNARAAAKSSLCARPCIPNVVLSAVTSAETFAARTESTCAMTASTSAEQFAGIDWRIGSKYPQKLLKRDTSQEIVTLQGSMALLDGLYNRRRSIACSE